MPGARGDSVPVAERTMRVVLAFLTSLASLGLLGCGVTDDNLEPNDDAAHATPLPLGEARDAVVILGNDDVYATEVAVDTTLLFELHQTGHEREARIALINPDGSKPDLPTSPTCSPASAPPPRLVCVPGGDFDLVVPVHAGEKGVVVVYQPSLCVECFNGESSEYTIAVKALSVP